MKNASSASDGTARPTFDVAVARKSPRPRWPSHSDSGIASAAAIASAAIDTIMCVAAKPSSSGMPPICTPPETDSRSLKMNSIASPKSPRKASAGAVMRAPAARGS